MAAVAVRSAFFCFVGAITCVADVVAIASEESSDVNTLVGVGSSVVLVIFCTILCPFAISVGS